MEDILPRELTSPVLRRGKWTAEEERYTEKIIGKLLTRSFSLLSKLILFFSLSPFGSIPPQLILKTEPLTCLVSRPVAFFLFGCGHFR